MRNKINRSYLAGALAFFALAFLSLPAIAGTPHTSYGIVTGGQVTDTWTFYVASRPAEKLTGNITAQGASFIWRALAGNLASSWTVGDDSVAFVAREAGAGTTAHAGSFAVMNETLSNTNPQAYNTSTIRAIPVPTAAAAAGAVNLTWVAAATDASETPVGNNIIGYNVYRSTNPANTANNFVKINAALVAATNYTDSTGVAGTTYYYAIEPVFKGTVALGIISANSLAISPLPVAAPTVTNVTATNANGTYGTGSVINVTVTFDKAVTVTGAPRIQLETGTTDQYATYASGTGTATLTFNYTVAAGDSSSDLNYLATNSLALNGGTIKDAANNNATLTLPALASANSLGGSKAIVIDAVAPTVSSVSSTTPNGTYGVGSTIAVTVAFNKVVNVTGTPQIQLETGATDRQATYASGTGSNTLTFNYTVVAVDTSSDLNYVTINSLALNGGTIKDAANNNATLILPDTAAPNSLGGSKAIVIDTAAPTVSSVSSTTPNGTYGVGSTIAVTVTFNKAVNVTGTPRIQLETGTTDQYATYASGTGSNVLTFNYTVVDGDTSADLDYKATTSLGLNGGTIKDAANNAATLTLPAPAAANSLGGSKAIVIDTAAPKVLSVSATNANGTYSTGSVINVTVTFDKTVAVTGTPRIQLETGTADHYATYASGTGTTTLTFDYTVAAGDASPDLNYLATNSLTLNGGTINNASGSPATLTLPALASASSLGGSKAIVIDAVAPTVSSVSSSTINGSYSTGAIIAVTVTFSEPVTVSGTPQIQLETGASDAIVNYSSGSGTATLTFNYTVAAGHTSPDLNYLATNSLTLNGGTIKDAANNVATLTLPALAGASSLAGSKAIVIDTAAPTVGTPFDPASGAINVAIDKTITITFSEAMNTGTFAVTFSPNPGGVSVVWSNGNRTATISHNAFANETPYTVAITVAQDAAGNSIASLPTTTFTTIGLPPNAPTNLGPAQYVNGSTVNTNHPTYTFTLSDPNPARKVGYVLEYSSNADFSGANSTSMFAQLNQGPATATPAGNCAEGNNYWRVKTVNDAGAESAWTTANNGNVAFIVDTAGPTVTSIAPISGAQGQNVSITDLIGTNFRANATVKLTKAGQADINATNVGVSSATKITCTFPLAANTATGTWNVVVTNSDASTGTLANGFTVNAAVAPGIPLNLMAAKSGNDVILSWDSPAVGEPGGGYRVYRGTSPTTINFQIGADIPAGTHTRTDAGAILTQDSYYYVVKAFAGPTESGPSNIAYKLKKTIEYNAALGGKTLISIPYKTSYTTLASIIQDIEGINVTTMPGTATAPTKVSLIARFNPTTQLYENLYWSGSEWLSDTTSGTPPPMLPGEAIELRAMSSFSHSFVGEYDPNFSLSLVYKTGMGNKNLISIPYNTNYTTLASMIQQIEGIDVTAMPGIGTAPTKVSLVARFNPTTQLYENLYWSGSEWLSDTANGLSPTIVIGEGYEINILQSLTLKPSVQ